MNSFHVDERIPRYLKYGCSKKQRLSRWFLATVQIGAKTPQCNFNTTSQKVKRKCVTSILGKGENIPFRFSLEKKMCTEQQNMLLNCRFLCPMLLALQCDSIFNSLRTSSIFFLPHLFFFLSCWHNNLWLAKLADCLATLASNPSPFPKGMTKTCCMLYISSSSSLFWELAWQSWSIKTRFWEACYYHSFHASLETTATRVAFSSWEKQTPVGLIV